MSGMNNLTTLIKRLEAATSRLEDIVTSADGLEPSPPQAPIPGSAPSSLAATNDQPQAAIASPLTPSPPARVEEDLPDSVRDFDSIVDNDLKPFETMGEGLGGLASKAAIAFGEAFRAQRTVVLIASKAKEPEQTSSVYPEILKELIVKMQVVQAIRDQNRKCPEENHLAMLADGVDILAWVTMKPKPDEYVAETLGGAQMFGNRILREYKEKDETHVAWVRSFVKVAGSLRTYIKDHHARGLSWNISGVPADQALRDAQNRLAPDAAPRAPSAPVSGGAPPPPPPPPPPPMLDIPPPPGSTAAASAPSDMSSVFADLNKGAAVTSSLKKVDTSQMTHKNPSLRAQGAVPVQQEPARGKSPTPARKPDSMRTKKPPRKELAANKWMIEHFDNEASPIEIQAERNHSILISRCKSTTIRVVGKANAISIDNCQKLDIVIDSLVSSADVINTSNFRMQILGTLPAVQLDKVDVGTLYLSKESLSTDVVTSKCSSINVTLPPSSDEDDSVECPVPEQIRTRVNAKTGKLESEIVYAEG